jgi:hypothetical protein
MAHTRSRGRRIGFGEVARELVDLALRPHILLNLPCQLPFFLDTQAGNGPNIMVIKAEDSILP